MKQDNSGGFFSLNFPYTIIDNYLDAETVRAINDEWPEPKAFRKEGGRFTIKWNCQDLPPTAKLVADSVDLKMLESVTGIQGLLPDPTLAGAGLHCIPRGGFLNMHCDFNVHPVYKWARRVNMLIYLNEDWGEDWGGELLLSNNHKANPAVKVEPLAGRAVIFETNERSWHGHPEPLRCPDDRQRRSLALYFYTATKPEQKPHSTIYKK